MNKGSHMSKGSGAVTLPCTQHIGRTRTGHFCSHSVHSLSVEINHSCRWNRSAHCRHEVQICGISNSPSPRKRPLVGLLLQSTLFCCGSPSQSSFVFSQRSPVSPPVCLYPHVPFSGPGSLEAALSKFHNDYFLSWFLVLLLGNFSPCQTVY